MTIINSINNTRFSFNGIEYLRNYISVVRGDRIEIFNCYEQEDVLLCLTHYNQVSLNGTIHTSAANLHSALQNVIYSRSTLSGEDIEIIDQNNIGKVIHLGYLSSQNFSTEVPQRINALSTTLTATDSPVFFTGYYTSPTGNQKLTYQFMGGKGDWGVGGASVEFNQLLPLSPNTIAAEDVASDENSNIIPLEDIEENDFIDTANTTVKDFTDSSKQHYLSYSTNGTLYIKRFIGQPGEYGGAFTPLANEDFESITDSNVKPGAATPKLQDILEQSNVITTPIATFDNNTASKTTYKGSGIEYENTDGFITKIEYQNNSNTVNYKIPAKPGDDTFAMLTDVNGLTLTSNQATSEIYLKNASGSTLATLNVAFLNNEGTTFVFNNTTEKLELRNEQGALLSEIPVGVFVSNMVHSAGFNAETSSQLDFKDSEGNVVFSANYQINNISGLQNTLNNLIGLSGDSEVSVGNLSFNSELPSTLDSETVYFVETHEFEGAATAISNGVSLTISIPHGLGMIPSYCAVHPKNALASGFKFFTADTANIVINYSPAPASGSLEYWITYKK